MHLMLLEDYQKQRENTFMPKFRFPAVLCSLLCLLTLPLTSIASAQAASPPQSSDTQNAADDSGPTETLKVNVNVVQLFFNVKDKRGALIPNLTKEDFHVFEDGKPETIKYFT